jgi:phage terminase small subunit
MGTGMLTPKQARFAEEYCIDLCATRAAIRAGYSAKTAEQQGYQLLQHPSVQATVEAGMKAKSAETRITRDWIVRRAVAALDAATAARAHSAVTRNIELLAKLHGHMVERRDVRKVTAWADLTDEELAALAADHVQRLGVQQ